MKMMKRMVALCLCFLLLNNLSLRAFMYSAVSENDIVVERAVSMESQRACEECGSSGDHAVSCSYNTTDVLYANTNTAQEITGAAEQLAVSAEDSGAEQASSEAMEAGSAPTAAQQLLATNGTEEMYALMLDLMESDRDGLLSLTAEEIAQLRDHVNQLDPEGDDADTVDLLDTLNFLPNSGVDSGAIEDMATYATYNYTWNGEETFTAYANNVYNVTITGDVNLTGYVQVSGTLNITTDGKGKYTISRSSGSLCFQVSGNGKLVIDGTEVSPITIKGYNGGSYAAITVLTGTLNLNHVNIVDANRTSGYNYKTGLGGAIQFGNGSECTVNSTIENTTISNCASPEGSAIGFFSSCSGNVILKNSVVKNCRTTGTYGGTIRTLGDSNCKLTIESCTIQNNYSNNNGGGVYWNARGDDAGLTITGTAAAPTKIINNEAINGGGIFLSGSSITIEHTQITGNKATYGGGIDMQPYDYSGVNSGIGCNLTLGTGAKIINNTATEYGGGIYMQIDSGSTTDGQDFVVTVQSDATIQGNSAKYGGAIAITQELGSAEGGEEDRKYDVYVKIEGGTIGGSTDAEANKATENGGAFYINREYGNAGAGYDLKVEISGGQILGNTAVNGGAIYLTDNATNGTASVTVSGGTIGGSEAAAGNTAVNGGAVYLSGGSYTMSGGTVSNNAATENGGAVYVSGGNYTMSGGTVSNNTAKNGGSAYVSGGNYTMGGGTVSENTATASGGAAYVTNGTFTMNNGTVSNNTAYDGGAAYISGIFNMVNGTLIRNTATRNGGAVYVTNGEVTMSDGSLSENSAKDGGAVYVSGGRFTMYGGSFTLNTAQNGGAVYATNGDFGMISGSMLNNGTRGNVVTEYGGAVCVRGGNISVGVDGCDGGEEGAKHTVTHTDKVHPIIKSNKAQYGGAFAVRGTNDSTGEAINGIVYVYCSHIIDNQANNEGTGHNFFMEGGGVVHYMDSAVIGTEVNHQIVSIGGELTIKDQAGNMVEIKLIYDSNATTVNATWIGTGPEGYYINLPYCPTAWQDVQDKNGKVFVGWTQAQDGLIDVNTVRDKNDYDPIGKPVEIRGDSQKEMKFYAVWAPKYNNISYAYSVDGSSVIRVTGAADIGVTTVDGDNFSQYQYSNVSYDRNLPDASRIGYTFVGWLVYADTSKISNWDADPLNNVQSNAVQYLSEIRQPTLWTGKIDRNFGDITLVAVFAPIYVDLVIRVNGTEDPDATFIFAVSGDPLAAEFDVLNLDIVIVGDDSVTVKGLPVGEYTVTEKTGWSWRYTLNEVAATNTNGSSTEYGIRFTLDDPANAVEVSFQNECTNRDWLSTDYYFEVLWIDTNETTVKTRKSEG